MQWFEPNGKNKFWDRNKRFGLKKVSLGRFERKNKNINLKILVEIENL